MATSAHNFSQVVESGAFIAPSSEVPYITDSSAALLALAQGEDASAFVATRTVTDYSQATLHAEPVAAVHAVIAAGNSVRRATAVVAEAAGESFTFPEVNPDSDVHSYSPDAPAGSLARCGASLSERLTRHGHRVTCQTCKELHAEDIANRPVDEYDADAEDSDTDGSEE
jgi:hypothetical protein